MATRHKVFISFYHKDDEKYRVKLENEFGNLFIAKSVQDGGIASENSDEYIKRLIQEKYIEDASVLVVLVGPKTKCRKHVDWEISAGLNKKVGGSSGLIGVLLPTFPLSRENTYDRDDLPKRLDANVHSGYAKLYKWSAFTKDDWSVTSTIQQAFDRRSADSDKIVNTTIPQRERDSCE